jgi:mannose-6-phosphate isomerase-like protein (cupin superfamily)
MEGMEAFRHLASIGAFTGADGARVQELAGQSCGLNSHSLAIIVHPPGTASRGHHHTVADEVYYVLQGSGSLHLENDLHALQTGDIVVLRPGQYHKVCNDGAEDLVLVVTCAPAYQVDEVVWDEA